MATNSILKTIRIKDKNLAKGLLSALENAEGKKSKQVIMKHPVKEVKSSDEIKEIFGE